LQEKSILSRFLPYSPSAPELFDAHKEPPVVLHLMVRGRTPVLFAQPVFVPEGCWFPVSLDASVRCPVFFRGFPSFLARTIKGSLSTFSSAPDAPCKCEPFSFHDRRHCLSSCGVYGRTPMVVFGPPMASRSSPPLDLVVRRRRQANRASRFFDEFFHLCDPLTRFPCPFPFARQDASLLVSPPRCLFPFNSILFVRLTVCWQAGGTFFPEPLDREDVYTSRKRG